MINFDTRLLVVLAVVLRAQTGETGHEELTDNVGCSLEEWTCNDGQCISRYDQCDGTPECRDGSDEIAENCIHYASLCPEYGFSCSYGGCIQGNFKCNGKQDCSDNSDEQPLLCDENKKEIRRQLFGNCKKSGEFMCGDGKCLDSIKICDGKADCVDKSDEALQLCSTQFCPDYAFKCANGGCITGTLKCNGEPDCDDKSDEAPSLCHYERVLPKTEPKPSKTGTTPPSLDKCVIPSNDKNLVAEDPYYKSILEHDSTVGKNTIVKFSCSGEGENEEVPAINSTCIDGSWTVKPPVCNKYCPAYVIARGISTKVVCYYKGKRTSCTKQLRSGTQVHVRCADGYKISRDQKRGANLTCDADGDWDYPKIKCTPQCGHTTEEKFYEKEMPWEASIYMRSSTEATFNRKCSGLIISPKIVITAASCFTDSDKDANDHTYYNVVEGLHRNPYKQHDNNLFVVHNISMILFPPHFKFESKRNTLNDIALLTLVNYFQFSPQLQPICLQTHKTSGSELVPYDTLRERGALLGFERNKNKIVLTAIVGQENESGTIRELSLWYHRKFINATMDSYYFLL